MAGIPTISSVTPRLTLPGGRIVLHGAHLPVTTAGLPVVRLDGHPARVVFASSSDLAVVVSDAQGGRMEAVVEGVDGRVPVDVAIPLATGLHQVDNPVFDRDGNLYVTYSGSRGQQVPVSIFRVLPGGVRESFSSAVTNPTSMALSPDGELFVSSRFEGTVFRLDEDGNAETYASDLGIACGLAFAPDGTLFVGDRSGTIFAVDRDGKTSTLASLPASVAAFHLAVGPDGLYVTAPTLSAADVVYRVTFSGEVSVMHTGFGRPQGLGFGPDGHLHVVEALAGASGLYRLGPGGAELVLSGPGLIGFAFDAAGVLAVCSGDTAYRVQV
ncbi:MAG: gluconolaconase [Vicinamibacterales bacterium]